MESHRHQILALYYSSYKRSTELHQTTHAALFPDNTNISCREESSADIEQQLNIDLENMHSWLIANRHTLNMEKTVYMIIGLRQKLDHISTNPNIIIGDQVITRVKEKKTLGVIIDEQQKWKEYMDAQSKRISNNIALLRRAKKFVSQETLLKMYNTFVLPHFIYCSNVWLDGTMTNINKLYKLQKRAARVITGASYEIRSSELFENLNWKPLETNSKK